MSNVQTDDPRIAKILGLLDKTTERGCTPEEAEAAFAAAQRLMAKYAIDEALLGAARGNGQSDKIITDRSVRISGSYVNPLGQLWLVIARANDCHMFWSKYRSQATVVITGYESNVKQVLLLGAQLQLQLLREIRRCNPDYDPYAGRSKGMQAFIYRRSFADGWAARIGQRLTEVRRETVNEAAASNDSLLPALRDKKQAVDQYVKDTFKLSRSRGRSGSYDYNGAAAGRSAANRADIGSTRIGGSSRALNR